METAMNLDSCFVPHSLFRFDIASVCRIVNEHRLLKNKVKECPTSRFRHNRTEYHAILFGYQMDCALCESAPQIA